MSTLNWNELIKDAEVGGGNNYEPMPDGDYELKVLEAETKTTQSGKVMFSTKCEVVGGPNAKRLVWDNLVVSPDNPTALGIFFRKMDAMGLGKESFFDRQPTNPQIEQALVGRSFRGQIGTRVYNNKKSNEIKNYYASASAAPAAPATSASASAPASAPAPAPAPAPAFAPAPAAAAPSAPF
jgi:hypothetical protein